MFVSECAERNSDHSRSLAIDEVAVRYNVIVVASGPKAVVRDRDQLANHGTSSVRADR